MVAENPDPEEENLVEDKTVSDIKIPQEEVQKEKFSNPDFDSENDEETISFEPLHTVDYFASQGIKIDEEALANDHLVKQVKSFTAWLKTMKKLHPGQLPEQNEVIEKIIQSASEASNQDANVLTEAMAEVLTKQGKREKAIEMYEKLSLINPSKSAYFAAKIESLKII
jgi:tetratricopeptide (TPR) repeat protein